VSVYLPDPVLVYRQVVRFKFWCLDPVWCTTNVNLPAAKRNVSVCFPVSSAYVLFYASMLIFPAWFAGRLVCERRRRASAFRELAAQAAADQAEHESAAITEERARIGSELQDIIAHSVSAMVIQAGGARQLLDIDPGRARDSILNVEHTGREALADLRRLLGMLRKDDDPRALAPQPGLGQLAALMDSTRATGLACELRILGERIDLTPGVDLVAYRLIEAAVLSAAHHRCSSAVVTVRYQPHELAGHRRRRFER
jgi:signal transduction histidine kinase